MISDKSEIKKLRAEIAILEKERDRLLLLRQGKIQRIDLRLKTKANRFVNWLLSFAFRL